MGPRIYNDTSAYPSKMSPHLIYKSLDAQGIQLAPTILVRDPIRMFTTMWACQHKMYLNQ